jgi:putative peptidoglycan lipid II flippase
MPSLPRLSDVVETAQRSAGYLSDLTACTTPKVRKILAGRLFRAVALVTTVATACKVAASLKEIAVAARFGSGAEVDVFLMAFTFPAMFVNVVSASMPASFIPQYVYTRTRHGDGDAHALYSNVLLTSISAALLASILCGIWARVILGTMAKGFDVQKLQIAIQCFYVLLPLPVLTSMTMLWSGVLNAHDRFLAAAMYPIITTLATVAAVMSPLSGVRGGLVLACAATLGAIAEAVFIGASLKRSGFHLSPGWSGIHALTPVVAREFAFLAACGVGMGGVTVINQSLAGRLQSGSVAAFSYGAKVTSLVASVGTAVIASIVLPQFSRLAANECWARLKRVASIYIVSTAAMLVPVTVALIAASRPLVHLLFERGRFTAVETQLVASIQACYFLQIPFVLPGLIGIRLLMSLGANRQLLLITTLDLAVTAAISRALASRFGVAGLALSTSIMYALACICCLGSGWRLLSRRVRQDIHAGHVVSSIHENKSKVPCLPGRA